MTRLIPGDCIAGMKYLRSGSAYCCVTSPPYFGLRDYGVAGQIGLEPTPEAYVARLVEVFREVRRVLRDDGTLWLNLGDSYAGGGGGNYSTGTRNNSGQNVTNVRNRPAWLESANVKQKDLLGIPWMVAFALRTDGWYLRSDIIWHKPNPMPESVTDRPTKAHEYLFLLAKSATYYYDAGAVKEDAIDAETRRGKRPRKNDHIQVSSDAGYDGHRTRMSLMNGQAPRTHRNRRSVWTVVTKPYKGAHFATFPPALIEPCVLAGCPAGGTVLDPFMGSGTTGAVCVKHGRDFVGVELNRDYIVLARKRIHEARQSLSAQGEVVRPDPGDVPPGQ